MVVVGIWDHVGSYSMSLSLQWIFKTHNKAPHCMMEQLYSNIMERHLSREQYGAKGFNVTYHDFVWRRIWRKIIYIWYSIILILSYIQLRPTDP